MNKIKITYKPLENGRRGVIVSTPCPNGKDCMVGSKECGRCKGYAPRKSNHQFVFCKIDNPLKL